MSNRAYAAEKEKNQKFREVDNMLVKKQVIKNHSALKCAISVSPGLCVPGPNLSEKIMKLGNMHIIQQVATIIGARNHAMSKCFGLYVRRVEKILWTCCPVTKTFSMPGYVFNESRDRF